MFQIRIHGRSGQGIITAAELLSIAAFMEDHHAQAFPSFSSERAGAPVTAFCRINEREILLQGPITQTDALVIQDPTLLPHLELFQGLSSDGYVLVNSSRSLRELGIGDYLAGWPADHALAVPATEIARKFLGKSLPNCALCGGLVALTGRWTLPSLCAAIRRRFPGPLGDDSAAAAAAVYDHVQERLALLRQIEGAQAVAETLAQLRPEVLPGYPIPPEVRL